MTGSKSSYFCFFCIPVKRDERIDIAERLYKDRLKEECSRLFLNTDIPSHDHHHHERVWRNATILIERLFASGQLLDDKMAEKAIIASYFHDTGLTVNRGPDHGKQSREICSRFLMKNNIEKEIAVEVLDAVERHDDKEYTADSDPASLAAILSVADDMDAFGETGVERYLEIYAVRGVAEAEMASRITCNAESRFRHLADTYKMFPDFVKEQRKRLDILINHFNPTTR